MPSDRDRARKYHQSRPKRERVADESFRAVETTTDYETWRAAPSRRDYEGVDTVAPRIKRTRARRALETAEDKGLVDEFVEATSKSELPGEPSQKSAFTKGNFNATTGELGLRTDKGDEDERAFTLAHEVGHAVDHGKASTSASAMQGLGIGDLGPVTTGEQALDTVGAPAPENEVAKEVREVSEERRGEIEESRRDYREDPVELFADYFGAAITTPRNTKARTPKTRERIGEVFEEDAGEEFSKDPSREFVEETLPDDFLPDRL